MKKELNIYIKSRSSFGEIKLFQEMHRYLSLKYICTFIAETHQHYVEFKSPSTKCTKKKELSDLWIITYSPKMKKAKMTFLQAKFEKNKKPIKIPFNFNGDYYQYDLLSQRPQITDKSSFKFPRTILSNAISDSVGSFGIFYFDTKKQLDFAFSTASDICFKKKATCSTTTRRLYFKGINYTNVEIRLSKHSGVELRSTLNADCFEYGLLNLFIGTPIEKDNNIINFLRFYFKNKNATNLMDFKDFLSTIETDENENNHDNKEDRNTNILLINIDGS